MAHVLRDGEELIIYVLMWMVHMVYVYIYILNMYIYIYGNYIYVIYIYVIYIYMLYMGCWLNKYEQATTLPSKICVLHHAHRILSAIGHASSKITAWLKVHRWPRGSCLEFLVLRARSTPHWATRELVATGEMHRIGRLGYLGLI